MHRCYAQSAAAFSLAEGHMLLNPRQLEAFRLVMIRGSVTMAARELNVSQTSAVSFAISRSAPASRYSSATAIILCRRRR